MKEDHNREARKEQPQRARAGSVSDKHSEDKLTWSAPKVKRLKIGAATVACLTGSLAWL